MGAMGWAGLGQATGRPPSQQCPGPSGQDLQGTTEPGPRGFLGALATGADHRLSPAAAHQLVGHLLQLRLDGPTSSPAPGPWENPQSHPGWSVECTVSLVAPWPSCVTLDVWLCLSEHHLFHGDSEAALLHRSEKLACRVCALTPYFPWWTYSGPPLLL